MIYSCFHQEACRAQGIVLEKAKSNPLKVQKLTKSIYVTEDCLAAYNKIYLASNFSPSNNG